MSAPGDAGAERGDELDQHLRPEHVDAEARAAASLSRIAISPSPMRERRSK